MYVPKAVIWHKEHYVTFRNHKEGFIEFYLARNHVVYARRHVPLRVWPVMMPVFCAWMIYGTLVFSCRLEGGDVLSLDKGCWWGCIGRGPCEVRSLLGRK